MPYNALIICSIKRSDIYLVDMIENSLTNQGFDSNIIGKNPHINLEPEYIQELVEISTVFIIIITNAKHFDIINNVLSNNISLILKRKRKPVMLISTEKLVNQLKDKSSLAIIVKKIKKYEILEVQSEMEKHILKFKDLVDETQMVKDLGTLGLILSGIGIGAGLLFYLMGDEDE